MRDVLDYSTTLCDAHGQIVAQAKTGGEAKGVDAVLEEVRQLAAGGAFGAIMGRNAFQRPRAEALKLLGDVTAIYKSAP